MAAKPKEKLQNSAKKTAPMNLADAIGSDKKSMRSSKTVKKPLRVGNYQLIEQVGRGAHGRVWKAKNMSTGKLVAVK